jgi:hypothetical protein
MRLSGEDRSDDRPAASSGSQNTSARHTSAQRLELGSLATTRVLFALTLLGVLLPFNAIASRYHQVGFTYSSPYAWLFIPAFKWHLHAISFLYVMEALLAVAVYLYGFDFLFGWPIFQPVGTALYAIALFVPPVYLYMGGYALFYDVIGHLNVYLFYIISGVANLLFTILLSMGVLVVALRLEGKDPRQRMPAEHERP